MHKFIEALDNMIEIHNKIGIREFHKLEPYLPNLTSMSGETITMGFNNTSTKLYTSIRGNTVTFIIDKDEQFVYDQDMLFDEITVYSHVEEFIITLDKMLKFAYNEYIKDREDKYRVIVNSAIENMKNTMK